MDKYIRQSGFTVLFLDRTNDGLYNQYVPCDTAEEAAALIAEALNKSTASLDDIAAYCEPSLKGTLKPELMKLGIEC